MVSSVASLSTALFSSSSRDDQSSLKRTTVSRRTKTPTTTTTKCRRRRAVGGGCSLSSSSSSSLRGVKALFVVAKTTTLTILYLTVTMGGFVPTTSDFAMAMGGDDGTTTTTTTVRTENASVFNGKYSDPNHPGCLRGIGREYVRRRKRKCSGKMARLGVKRMDKKRRKNGNSKASYEGKTRYSSTFPRKEDRRIYSGSGPAVAFLFPDGNTWSKL